MSSPISKNLNQAGGAFAPQRTQQANTQQSLQRLNQNNNAQQTGAQDSSSFSQEALEDSGQDQSAAQAIQGLQATQGQQQSSSVSPDQLESQIQSGDLQGALSTISQLESNKPAGQTGGPSETLKSQLKEKLQQGDQEGAQSAFDQIKANKPAGAPQQQQQQKTA
jgi:hypothetical protein